MKSKSIEKLLKGMIDNLCESIDEECIKVIIREKSFISGGCIPTMLMDGFVNDFDFYFIDKESSYAVKSFYEKKKDKKDKFHVKLITENAINLSDKVQLITKFYGEPKDVVKKFDWQHIKSWYSYSKGLNLTDDIYKLIMEKELIYTGSDYPLSSLLRLKKYIKNGWNVSNATIVHIALDVSSSFHLMHESKHQVFDDVSIFNTQYVPDYDEIQKTQYSVEDIIYHMNGVDPLTIQAKLVEQTGKYLSIDQIVSLIN